MIEARFDFIRYANCWEDADLLCEALQPGGKRILSIASGGDNCFALLAAGAAEVVAADLSPAQLACVELKASAIQELDHPEFLAFIGITSAADRWAVFQDRLQARLTEKCAAYWTSNREALEVGMVHAGKFERYFQKFRTRILPLVHQRATIEALLAPRDTIEQRREFYRDTWDTWRWRLLFRIFFSRFVMGRLGRDPAFFNYVEGSVAERIRLRAESALTTLSTHDNPYLRYILTGNFGASLPPYLVPERYERLRSSVDRLRLHEGTIQEAASAHAGGGFDGFNLSDIFEYLSPDVTAAVYGELLSTARAGARLAYWNMLAPRSRPDRFAEVVDSLDELAGALHARDRAFFYQRFVVEEVRKNGSGIAGAKGTVPS